jgi:hypothetical protein
MKNEQWLDLEETLCTRTQRARQILRVLAKENFALDNTTVEALREIAGVLMDKVLSLD